MRICSVTIHVCFVFLFFSIFTIHVSGFITIMKVDMARNCVLSLIDERVQGRYTYIGKEP